MSEQCISLSRKDFLRISGLLTMGLVIPNKVFDIAQHEEGGITEEEIDFLRNHEISAGNRKRRVILMTYDDGGKPNDILTILNAYELYGEITFFLTAEWLLNNREIAQLILKAKHTLGCHGYDHLPFTSLSTKEMNEQFTKSIEAFRRVVPGYRVRFFRPPYGDRNQKVRDEAAKFGLQVVMWGLSSGGQDVDTCQRVLEGANNGAIVLCHSTRHYDIQQAEETAANLVKLGYSLESMDTGLDPTDDWAKKPSNEQPSNTDWIPRTHEPR
jgi:peptidoglycan/xylan/chitin deacetylase (PgdA/CDA1 family)